VTGDNKLLEEFVKEVAHQDHGKEVEEILFGEKTGETILVNQPLSFDKIIPMPSDLRSTTAPNSDEAMAKKFLELYDARDWYDWAIKNWDTKWDASFSGKFCVLSHSEKNVEVPENRVPIILDDHAFYAFDTAWSPPISVIDKAAGIWPNLTFELKYGEPGSNYAGKCVWENGSLVTDEDLPVEEVLTDADMWF
jgi:hypothetical protein